MKSRSHLLLAIFSLSMLLAFNGCGSSSGSGTGGGGNTADFQLNSSVTTLPVLAGGTATFKLSVQPLNGFTASVTVSGTLPTGITVSPSLPITLSSSTAQTITVTCAKGTPVGSYNLPLTGTSGSLSHNATVAISVVVPGFTLNITPGTLNINAGGQGTFQVTLVPQYGYSGSAQLQFSGFPANSSVTPSSPITITTESPQTLTVATSSAASAGSSNLSFQASSGSLSAPGTAVLDITTNSPPPSRADFYYTGDTPAGAAYDQAHKRVYVSNPKAGSVDVISSTTYQLLRRIPVPSPQGIDISPDDSIVFIGTGDGVFNTGMAQVFAVDTESMAIFARFSGAPFTSSVIYYPQSTLNPIATPDNCVLIDYSSSVGITGSIVKWNPVTGETTTVLTNPVVALNMTSPFRNTPYYIAEHSADHTHMIISNDNFPSTIWLYDTQQNQFVQSTSAGGYAFSVAANPNGTQYAVALDTGSAQYIYFLDSNLNVLSSVTGGGTLIYSADGSTLYVTGVLGSIPVDSFINTTTYQWSGNAPSMYFLGDYPAPMAVDETGRIFSQITDGLAIDDATDVTNYTGAENFPISLSSVNPISVALNQSQTANFSYANFSQAPAIWFGALPAQGTSANGATTTAPANSQSEVVNIRFRDADHTQTWLPQSYTYGVQMPYGPDIATPNDASATINIFGFGFNAAGGSHATIQFGPDSGTLASGNCYASQFSLACQPVTPPKLTAGETDLTVTQNGNSYTQTNTYHALQIGTYALDGTPFAVAYDEKRNQVYVAVTDHVDVFSLSTHAFVSTIQIPTLNGTKQLGGMTMTQDGSLLLVTNWSDLSVAVINPDNPSAATAVSVDSSAGAGLGPVQIVPINGGLAYVLISSAPQSLINYAIPASAKNGNPKSSDKKSLLHPLNTQSGVWQLDPLALTASPALFDGNGMFGYTMAASPDGNFLCLTAPNNGPTTLYDLSANTYIYGPLSDNQGADFCAISGNLVASASQNRYGMPIVSDLSMRPITQTGMRDYEYSDLLEADEDLFTVALDNTASLLYVPWGQELAIFDAHTGEFRERIQFPYQLIDPTAAPMALDQSGMQIFLFSKNGFTLVQLDSLPLAIGNLSVSGATWTITGTGFVSGTTLSVDGNSLPTTVTDANHISISGAPALASSRLITLTNPDGHTYTYDVAYLQ